MFQFIKGVILFNLISLLFSCNLYGQKNRTKDAAILVNLIDSLTNTIGPAAGDNLVSYFKQITVLAKNKEKFKLEDIQVDSLRYYYNTLSFNCDNAIRRISLTKQFDDLEELKDNFITLLKKGEEPWQTTIPVYLKLYKFGSDSLSEAEKNIIDNTASILRNNAKTSLDWARIVADKVALIVKKYRLNFYDDKFH